MVHIPGGQGEGPHRGPKEGREGHVEGRVGVMC